jgi:hypothetical protein
VGLIARDIERRGIPTVSLTSAWSITRSVNPPRAVFTDFPLGHTAGKPHDPDLQRSVMRKVLAALREVTEPGTIVTLPYQWSEDDSWKDRVMRPRAASDGASRMQDDRVERHAEPQYQYEADKVLATRSPTCPGCIWLEP